MHTIELFDNVTISMTTKYQRVDKLPLKRFYRYLEANPTAHVLDIGAYYGLYTLLALQFPDVTVTAIEPNTTAGQTLINDIVANNAGDRAVVFSFAITNNCELNKLHLPLDGRLGLSTLGTPKRFKQHTTITVPTITLDKLVTLFELPPIDFIKVDVEGAELTVLQSGERTIRQQRPTMILEHDNRNTQQFGYNSDRITELLTVWGATITPISNEDIYVTW